MKIFDVHTIFTLFSNVLDGIFYNKYIFNALLYVLHYSTFTMGSHASACVDPHAQVIEMTMAL